MRRRRELVHLERRARPEALERRVPGLAVQRGRADLAPVGLVVERDARERLAVGGGRARRRRRRSRRRRRGRPRRAGSRRCRRARGSGSATAPPCRPECRSRAAPGDDRGRARASPLRGDRDRRLARAATSRRRPRRRGRPRARPRCASRNAGRLGLPISSSPSIRKRTFSGSCPPRSWNASPSPARTTTGPLSSVAPRA